MGETCLPEADPVGVDAVTVADQDTVPLLDEGFESISVASFLDHEEGDGLVGHNPKPAKFIF